MEDNTSNYPVELTMKQDIEEGNAPSRRNPHVLIENENAITIKININSNDYYKEDVRKALNETFQLILEYY